MSTEMCLNAECLFLRKLGHRWTPSDTGRCLGVKGSRVQNRQPDRAPRCCPRRAKPRIASWRRKWLNGAAVTKWRSAAWRVSIGPAIAKTVWQRNDLGCAESLELSRLGCGVASHDQVETSRSVQERGQRPQLIPSARPRAGAGAPARIGGPTATGNARMRYPLRSTKRAATSSPRLATPTLAKMWRRCSCAVYGEISSLWAIRWVACPLRMSSATCCSRGVNP